MDIFTLAFLSELCYYEGNNQKGSVLMLKKNKIFLAAVAALCALTLLIPLTGGFAAVTDPDPEGASAPANPEDASEAANPVEADIGDIDLDGKITSADARLALRKAVDYDDHLTEQQLKLADVDLNGEITAADARYILRAAVGLEDLHNLQPLPEEPSSPANPEEPSAAANPEVPIPVPVDPTESDI